jgi:hypothetical protein
LKDAGFKTENEVVWYKNEEDKWVNICKDCYDVRGPFGSGYDGIHDYDTGCPTLSELIEACGNDFMLTNETGKWEAFSQSENPILRIGEAGAKFESEGSTPEEAVALLWLSINKVE